MKKIVCAIFFIIISSNVFCWEIANELNVHEPLNNAMFESFTGNCSNSPKYENTSIDKETKFEGISWHTGSQISVENKNTGFRRNETFAEWIKIGGIDADIDSTSSEKITVEEGNYKKTYTFEKALRHFYDPKVIPRHLTDYSSWAKNQGIPDPKMDHLTWAMSEKSHHWSFNQGLTLYKAALENVSKNNLPPNISNFDGYFHPDGDFRGNLFSAAFRALGETLHCAGDLCMPAHVRDDAHGGEDLAGGIDPIELSIGYSQAIEILRNKKGTPSPADLSKSSVKEILEYCANFTNENFFSTDSICNVEPQIAPRSNANKNYPFPNFLKSEISRSSDQTQQLKRSIAGEEVVLAEESLVGEMRDPIFGKIVREGHLQWLVPKTAAEGQASVLLPLAAAAGGEIIDRFLPTMKLTLEISKDQNNSTVLNGSLVHEIDKDIEWKSIGAIKYCGEGEIKVNSSTVATATFVDGVMNTVKGMSFKANDKVQLVVKAGALIHNSNTVIISDAVVITPAITLTCLKSSNFTQLLQKVAVEDSRRVGYIGTLKPEIMATVLAEGNDTIAYNWWCDDATGTWVSDYFAPFTYSTFPYHDRPIFSQDGITPKDLKPKQIENTKYFCAPAGNHTLHIRAYYGSGAYQGLLESPVDKSSRNYVQKDVTFTVTAATSPIIRYKGDAPWEEISFKETAVEENFTGPEWAPNTWKRLKFKFDGPYTCYFDYTNNPNFKITGFYKDGIPSDHWKINCSSCRWVFDYDATGKIVSGVMKYDGDGNLVAKYTTSDLISPSFLVLHEQTYNSPTVINAHVEIFRSGNEIYNEQYNVVESVKKEGPYSYTKSDFKTVAGFYKNNVPTGFWEINNFSSGKWLFELNSEGEVLSGVKKYDSDGNLMAQYTSNTFVEPSFKATFRESSKAFESVETAYVETYSSAIEEKYYIVDGLKEGSYNSIKPNGERASGQYSRGRQIGVWSYYNPEFSPPEYTKTY